MSHPSTRRKKGTNQVLAEFEGKPLFAKIKMKGDEIRSIFPDIPSLMKTHQTEGSELVIPVSVLKNKPAFWEQGGRNPEYNTATGTVITGSINQILPIITMNKRYRTPNGRQALMPLSRGGKLFVGKVFVPQNSPGPRIKVFELVYDKFKKSTVEGIGYGIFKVARVYQSYGDMLDCRPAVALVDKLFERDVIRPFYGNGWSVTNVQGLDMQWAIDQFNEVVPEHVSTNEEFVANIEDCLVNQNNTGLSSALQVFDLNKGIATMVPLMDLILSDLVATANKAAAESAFSIKTEELFECFNPAIAMDIACPKTLEIAIRGDYGKYFREVDEGVHLCLRGWKG